MYRIDKSYMHVDYTGILEQYLIMSLASEVNRGRALPKQISWYRVETWTRTSLFATGRYVNRHSLTVLNVAPLCVNTRTATFQPAVNESPRMFRTNNYCTVLHHVLNIIMVLDSLTTGCSVSSVQNFADRPDIGRVFVAFFSPDKQISGKDQNCSIISLFKTLFRLLFTV